MHHTDNPQSFLPPYESNPIPRRPVGISGSIWAPQPQPSDNSWPRTLDSFSRVAEKEVETKKANDTRNAVNLPTITREDVFGAVPPVQAPVARIKDIGAIGDGRKKNSPEFDDSHVEQLLRTLNLNSPAPYNNKRPSLTLNFDASNNSPDFSPASATSALLTPTDLSPARSFEAKLPVSSYENGPNYLQQSSLLFEQHSPRRLAESLLPQSSISRPPSHTFPYFESFADNHPTSTQSIYTAIPPTSSSQSLYSASHNRRVDSKLPALDWRLLATGQGHSTTTTDWLNTEKNLGSDFANNLVSNDHQASLRSSFIYQQPISSHSTPHEPINFLSLLHPSSSPPYHVFVARIIKSSDQQASIFLQQKLKVADQEERAKIVDAICARGFEMMAHRFGNWAVQRCLEAASTSEERRKIVSCMKGRIVELATNCYGCHVLQKALDCEEDIRLLIVSELLLGDPAQTLVNKHASHVWSKIMELSWTPPAPPIFQYVNKSLKGKWASLACHETGSLVVQHAFENLEDEAKDGIVDELLNRGAVVFAEVAKNQWGSYCIQHILEHGSEKHRLMTLDHLLEGLLDFATNEQGSKSVTKALKEGGKETLARIVKRMCEPAKGARRAMIVDLALSVTGSQLIASVLPAADKDQRAALYECIRGHIVTLRGCKTGSKVIWLFDRMVYIYYDIYRTLADSAHQRAYYGY
ncbi:hypothetical protein AX16_002268 [Volvariella volvacea WC 439]|nr:hypothetical protein AX16_002268 [Volvariella volvacea WC 439]